MAQADPRIRDWLKALGTLSSGTMTAQEANARINAMTPLLANEFTPAAFTPASLAVVARACKFFPTYGELCDVLGPWWKANRPTPIAITADQNSTIKARQERAEAEASWKNITAEQVRAKIRTLDGHPMRDLLGHFLATALRRHASHHVGLLPPPWLADRSEPAEAVALRQPRPWP